MIVNINGIISSERDPGLGLGVKIRQAYITESE